MLNLEIAKLCFKYKNGTLPNSLNHMFTLTKSIHNHNTRSSDLSLYPQKAKKTPGYISLATKGSKIWNEIPRNIKQEQYFKTFIHKLKSHYINKYNENND